MGMMERLCFDISDILIRPADFFRSHQDTGLSEALRIYVLLLVFYALLTGIVRMIGNSLMLMDVMMRFPLIGPFIAQKVCPLFAGYGFLMIIGTVLIGLYLVFILSALLHPFVLLAGGEQGIGQTIKVLSYAAAPAFLIGWIPVVGIIGLLWSVLITIQGLRVCAGLTYVRSLGVVVVPILLLLLVPGLGVGIVHTVSMILNPLYWV